MGEHRYGVAVVDVLDRRRDRAGDQGGGEDKGCEGHAASFRVSMLALLTSKVRATIHGLSSHPKPRLALWLSQIWRTPSTCGALPPSDGRRIGSAPSAIASASLMSCSRCTRTSVTIRVRRDAQRGMWMEGFGFDQSAYSGFPSAQYHGGRVPSRSTSRRS